MGDNITITLNNVTCTSNLSLTSAGILSLTSLINGANITLSTDYTSFGAPYSKMYTNGVIYANGAQNGNIPVYCFGSTDRTGDISNGIVYPSNTGTGFPTKTQGFLDGTNYYNSPPGAGSNPYSIVSTWGILCGIQVDVFSDKRIKTNIIPLNINKSTPNTDLLRKLNPVEYTYIDHLSKGMQKKYGFIAQEAKEVLPSIVSLTKEFIPNVYELVEIVDKKIIKLNIKTKADFYIKNESDIIKLKLYIFENKENKLIQNEKIVTIKCFIDNNTIEINEEIDEPFGFLLGQQVDDFHVLNYESINVINLAATKELDEQLEETKKVVKEQGEEINKLKQEIQELKDLIYSKM